MNEDCEWGQFVELEKLDRYILYNPDTKYITKQVYSIIENQWEQYEINIDNTNGVIYEVDNNCDDLDENNNNMKLSVLKILNKIQSFIPIVLLSLGTIGMVSIIL